uniref:Integrase catalytic domain-containing protein n=1 Tax=Globodera rostochiensis TaxID=31243 RepID=A0A914HAS4_GLORO
MDRSAKDATTEHNNETDVQEKQRVSTNKMELINEALDKLYNDPSSPAAFAGVTALWKEARKNIKYLRKKDVQNYLEGHRTYTLMRPRRVRFPRAKTVAAGFMTDVQVDLADFQLFRATIERAEEMLEAFKQLVDQMPMVPHRIFSDKGTEFKNKLLKEFFKDHEIEKHEPVHSSFKASIAERAIRNVKQRIYRYFAEKQTMNWVDTVQEIVDGINRSPSRVHGMRPIDVNFSNAQRVWNRMYRRPMPDSKGPPRFHKDEFVRMSREKGQFEKGYLPNYGDEILEVDEVLKKVRPVRYKLRDDKGEKFRGSFYGQELAHDSTENIIIGNSLSSLLRVVSISGAIPGEYNEKIYDSPIFARVLPREINEIEIELRTMDKGRLVPFAYGTTMRGYGIQRGAGVGDVFRGLWRFFLPILRRVGTTVGSEALSTGQRVLERVGNEGVPLKEALVSEGKRGIDTVLEKGGLPKQFGKADKETCTIRRLWALLNMAFHKIDNDSVNSITNALDLFRIPPTNVSVSSSKVFELLTSNPLTDTPYHFKLHSSQNFIDLSKCYLLTEFRIRKENANGQLVNLETGDNAVFPIQMIGQTFIRNIRMSINGREIFNTNSLMAYKTYFSHELSYSTTAKDSHLNAAGYYRDPGPTLEDGTGCVARRNLFEGSKTAQFIAKIDADLFNQPLYLINFCELDVEIIPNDNDFLLIGLNAPARYRFEVTGLKMYVKKVSLMDGLALDIARKLELKPARYAVRKTMMKSMFISQGRFEFTSNIFMDQIPRRVILGLVANEDYVGTSARSPFNFQPFNVREISIVANGRSYPQAPYDLDYPNKKYVRAFNDMNEAVGFANTTESNGITFEQYGTTHCIYVFNMTSSGDDQAGLFDLIKNGTTAVCIKFSHAVPLGGIMLVVMGECDSLVMLDKNRSISSDITI